MNTTVYFAKTKPNAIIPSKRTEDAGFDIYACFNEAYMHIEPHSTVLIPTGLAAACSPSYCLILKERGSTGTKGMAQRCGVIDSGYRNEIFVPITNTTDHHIWIVKDEAKAPIISTDIVYPYTKAIAQILVLPVPSVTAMEIDYDALNSMQSERGTGCLGSSGK